MVVNRSWLSLDIPAKMDICPLAGKNLGVLSPYRGRRTYYLPPNLKMFCSHMWHLIEQEDPVSISSGVEYSKYSTYFFVDIEKKDEKESEDYFFLVYEPFEAIQELYPSIRKISPSLGVNNEGPWFALLNQKPDREDMGRAASRWLWGKEYSKEAILKASTLLERVCSKLGFNTNPTYISKGFIRISRMDASFTINNRFRCLTSDYSTPIDDQVAQKLLSLTSLESLNYISTLTNEDKYIITKTLNINP